MTLDCSIALVSIAEETAKASHGKFVSVVERFEFVDECKLPGSH